MGGGGGEGQNVKDTKFCKNYLIHGRVTATISKFSPHIFEMYFHLSGRVTTGENYTVGSSIFVSYTLGYSIFLLLYFRGLGFRSTQRAVLQKSCSTVGILLGKLIHFYVLLKYDCWETI